MLVGALALLVVAGLRVDEGADPLVGHLSPWAQPLAQADERDQFLYHAGILLTALFGFTGAWVCARLARAPQRVAAERPATRRPSRVRGGRDGVGAADAKVFAPVPRSWTPVLLHLFIVTAVVLLLYVPDYRAMAGRFLTAEQFHHWNFFAVMPAHAYLSGLTPALESYSQYGVGLPVIIGNVCRGLGDFSYATVVWVGMTYGVLYFVALYALLWVWLREWQWSVAGIAFAVLLQQFCGLSRPMVLWQYPSSTVLRSPFDVWLLLVLAWHLRRRAWAALAVGGLLVALAMFWETDTGLYLAGGYFAYCAFWGVDDLITRGWSRVTAYRYLAAPAIVPLVFFLLLWWSVGQAIFTVLFWTRFFEPLRLFHAGFGMLPMPPLRVATLHLFLTPAVYVFACVLALAAALRLSPPPWREGYLLGAVGVYGLGVYHQYVGRSHPWNWFHVSVPLVIVATVLGSALQRSLGVRLRERAPQSAGWLATIRGMELVPVVLMGLGGVLLVAAPTVRSYPGVLSGGWSASGVLWSMPGAGFRTRPSTLAFRDRVAAVVTRIQQAVPANEPVAILSEWDGLLYVMANRRPFSRFVPLYPAAVLDAHVDEVFAALASPRLRYVFLDQEEGRERWSKYQPALFSSRLAGDFELVDQVKSFQVWRRRRPVPGS